MSEADEGRVALVRGINVGGNHQIPMARLRELYATLGFEEVATYIQSGNVVFRTPPGAPDRSSIVEAAIAEAFGWPIRVVERTHDDLAAIVAADPFPTAGPTKRLVMFLFDEPSSAVATEFGRVIVGDDEAILLGREIQLHCPDGFGRTPLTKILTERRLGVVATTRNWRTVTTLLEMTR